MFLHNVKHCQQLFIRLSFCGKILEKFGSVLDGTFSIKYFVHRIAHFIIAEVFAEGKFCYGFCYHFLINFMKLLRIFLPSVVMTDSGWNWTPSMRYFL